MTPVTVDTGANNGYYASGDIGWSARSVFAHRVAISQLVRNSQENFGTTSTAAAFAQSFTPASSFDISTIRVGLAKTGAPTDNLTLEIRSDNANSPSSTVLATADNIHTNSSIATTEVWRDWHFSSPLPLSSGTKYWIVMARSGALDATNYFRVSRTTTSVYAGGGTSTYNSGTGLWSSESGFNDICFQVLQETPIALYHVTQDTSLHVWKSTDDGATWSEQDSANAPTVTNANYPFDASSTSTGPYIITARMTGTNAAAVRVFNMSADQWAAADYGTSPPSTVSNERAIRVANNNALVTASPGAVTLHFTDSADDADLRYQRVTGAGNAWAASVLVLSLTSGEASMYADVVMDQATPGFLHHFYYDCVNDDFSMRSLTGTTQGTEVDVDATAATSDTKYAVATYQPYRNGSNVTTVIAAYIDADDSVRERILNLDVTSASVTMASEAAVTASTSYAGRQLSTCRYDGTNYVFACTGSGIDYYESTTPGTWGSAVTLLSGGTAIVLSQAIAIEGYGLGIVYTNNGDATFDWVIAPSTSTNATGTVSVGTITASGQSITGTATVSATGTVSVGTVTASGQSVTATIATHATGTVSQGTITASGQSVTGTATQSAAATVAVGTIAASGQTVTATATASALGTISAGTIAATGEAISASFTVSATGTVAPGTIVASGQSVTALAGTSVVGTVQPGTAAASGVTVTSSFNIGAAATVNAGTVTASGQSITASAGTGVSATIQPGTIAATGQTVTATGTIVRFVGGLTGRIEVELTLAGTLAIQAFITGEIEIEPELAGRITLERELNGRIAVEPTLTARVEVA